MNQVLFLNPHKRGTKPRKAKAKRAKSKKRARTLFANPSPPAIKAKRRLRIARKSRRRLRSNPIRLPKVARPGTVIRDQVIPAMHGTLGALAVSAANGMLIDKLPIPAQYKSGAARDFLKALTAVGVAVVAQKAVKSPTSRNIAIGAMTMVAVDAARRQIIQHAPSVKLAGLESELFTPLAYWTPAGSGSPALTDASAGLGLHVQTAGGIPAMNLSGYDTATGFYQ